MRFLVVLLLVVCGGAMATVPNHRIQVFTTAGVFVRTWGTYGTGAGDFVYPSGIVLANGLVYISDATRIQAFTYTGDLVSTINTVGGSSHLALTDTSLFTIFSSGDAKLHKYDISGNDRGVIAVNGQYNVHAGGLLDDDPIGLYAGQLARFGYWQVNPSPRLLLDVRRNQHANACYALEKTSNGTAGYFVKRTASNGSYTSESTFNITGSTQIGALGIDENEATATISYETYSSSSRALQHVVRRYDLATGNLLNIIGAPGMNDGQFGTIPATTIDAASGLVFVIDWNVKEPTTISDLSTVVDELFGLHHAAFVQNETVKHSLAPIGGSTEPFTVIASGGRRPSIKLVHDGRVCVVYQDAGGAIQTRYSRDLGATWTVS